MNVLSHPDRGLLSRSISGTAAGGPGAAGSALMARARALWATGVESWRRARHARATARALASLGPAALRDLGLEHLADARRVALEPGRDRFLHGAW
ncbi:MAG: DUF1127 domain-containing protein [Acidobacteria bacterium]|nr:DUF1127 domain-containing protein [Acidobacteriota bacterium]